MFQSTNGDIEMDIETQRLLTLSLKYSEALSDDMHWRVQIFESGVDGFDTKEQMQKYASDLQDFVNELREILK